MPEEPGIPFNQPKEFMHIRQADERREIDIDEYGWKRGRLAGGLLVLFFFLPVIASTSGVARYSFHWLDMMPDGILAIVSSFSLAAAGLMMFIAAVCIQGPGRSIIFVAAAVLPVLLSIIASPVGFAGGAFESAWLLLLGMAALMSVFASGKLREFFPMSLAVRLTGFFGGMVLLLLALIPGLVIPGRILAWEATYSALAMVISFPLILIALVAVTGVFRFTPNTSRSLGDKITIITVVYFFALPWIVLSPVFDILTLGGSGTVDWVMVFVVLIKVAGIAYSYMALVSISIVDLVNRLLLDRYRFKLAQADTLKKVGTPDGKPVPYSTIKNINELSWLDTLYKQGMITRQQYEQRKGEILEGK